MTISKNDRDLSAKWLLGAERDFGNAARRLESGSPEQIKAARWLWALSGIFGASARVLVNRETDDVLEAP